MNLHMHLAADRATIVATFGSDFDPDALTADVTRVADDEGNIQLRFTTGLRLIYRPRDLAPEQTFAALLGWLNAHGLPLDLKLPPMLNCGSHGWIAVPNVAPCDDVAAVGRYYRRLGMLLGLLAALGGDTTLQHCVACGEYPLLYDLASLMSVRNPAIELERRPTAALTAARIRDAAIWAGLLPFAVLGMPHGEGDDQSRANLPILNSLPTRLEDYSDECVVGLRQLWALLIRHRATLLGPDQPRAIAPLVRAPLADRLRTIDESFAERSVVMLQDSLALWQAHHPQPFQTIAAEQPSGTSLSTLLAYVQRIADDLEHHAIRGHDEGAAWIGIVREPGSTRRWLQPLRADLYDGSSGVALFLAALAHLDGGDTYRTLALAALRPLCAVAGSASSTRLVQTLGIGGIAGTGSLIYTLLRVGQLLDEPALLDHATNLARAITPNVIAANRQLDLISGTAGALLTLLALHRETADSEVLALAKACGQHLLERRVASSIGLRSWPTLGQQLLSGLAHGAAGIAYALLQLFQATGQPAYRICAEEAIAYEQSLFCSEAGNWLDPRPWITIESQPSFMNAWCYGAAGIGLARLAGLGILDTPQIHHEIEAAIATTSARDLDGLAHVCCGVPGRMELLLYAAQHLGRDGLLDLPRRWAAQVVAQPISPRVGFFLGSAGIGYQLLRIAFPGRLPSVLLLES